MIKRLINRFIKKYFPGPEDGPFPESEESFTKKLQMAGVTIGESDVKFLYGAIGKQLSQEDNNLGHNYINGGINYFLRNECPEFSQDPHTIKHFIAYTHAVESGKKYEFFIKPKPLSFFFSLDITENDKKSLEKIIGSCFAKGDFSNFEQEVKQGMLAYFKQDLEQNPLRYFSGGKLYGPVLVDYEINKNNDISLFLKKEEVEITENLARQIIKLSFLEIRSDKDELLFIANKLSLPPEIPINDFVLSGSTSPCINPKNNQTAL